MDSKAWLCVCHYWTTEGRLEVEYDDVAADAGGLICPECGEHLYPGIHNGRNHVGIFSEEERYIVRCIL